MVRPKGPSQHFGCGSFVGKSRSGGEVGRAELSSQFLAASDPKRQILASLSHQKVLPLELGSKFV